MNIVKNSNGFTVKCSVSGGDMDLMKLDVYAPEMEQALILKKNFLDNPKKAYKIMLALLTKDKETVGEALENFTALYKISYKQLRGCRCDRPSVIIQKKRLRPSISVTPGIPPIIDTKSDKRLMGKVTPVKSSRQIDRKQCCRSQSH